MPLYEQNDYLKEKRENRTKRKQTIKTKVDFSFVLIDDQHHKKKEGNFRLIIGYQMYLFLRLLIIIYYVISHRMYRMVNRDD